MKEIDRFKDNLQTYMECIGSHSNILQVLLKPENYQGHDSPFIFQFLSTVLLNTCQNRTYREDALKIFIELFVCHYFPYRTKDIIFDALLYQDKSQLENILGYLNGIHLKGFKLLQAYTNQRYFAVAKTKAARLEKFLRQEVIHGDEPLPKTIHKTISISPMVTKMRLVSAAISTPYFFFSSYRNLIRPSIFEATIRALAPDIICPEQAKKASHVLLAAQLIQLMHGQSLGLPDFIYPLAALYPITDNYLDNPNKEYKSKLKLCNAIQKFLNNFFLKDTKHFQGYQRHIPKSCQKFLDKLNINDSHIDATTILPTLLELNRCQRLSIAQQHNYLDDIHSRQELFNLSYDKGAATFKLIALLVIPNISDSSLALYEKLGGFYQLLDDCSDLKEDVNNNILTFAADNILHVDQTRLFTSLEERYQYSMREEKLSTSLKMQAFLNALYHHIEELLDELREGKCSFSRLVINDFQSHLLHGIRHVLIQNNITLDRKDTQTNVSPAS